MLKSAAIKVIEPLGNALPKVELRTVAMPIAMMNAFLPCSLYQTKSARRKAVRTVDQL